MNTKNMRLEHLIFAVIFHGRTACCSNFFRGRGLRQGLAEMRRLVLPLYSAIKALAPLCGRPQPKQQAFPLILYFRIIYLNSLVVGQQHYSETSFLNHFDP